MLDYVAQWNSLPPHYVSEVMQLLLHRGQFTELRESALIEKIRKVKDQTQYNFDIALAIYTIAYKYYQQNNQETN